MDTKETKQATPGEPEAGLSQIGPAVSEESWWETGPTELPAVLARLQHEADDETDLFWLMFDYYNHLMAKGSAYAVQSVALGQEAAHYFRERRYALFEAMFLELVARSALSAGDLVTGLAAFEQMAEIHREDQRSELLELAGDVWGYAKRGIFGSDLQPLIFASIARVFERLEDKRGLAGAYLQASALYAQHGAHDAAARAVADARAIATAATLPDILVDTYEQEAVLAFERGDAAGSAAAAQSAFTLHDTHGTSPSFRLRLNLATAQMELGDLQEAADIYVSMIGISEDPDVNGSLHVNLASCLRRQNDLRQASANIELARDLFDEDTSYDVRLEMEIVAASIAVDCGNPFEVEARLRAAASMLDEGLRSVIRLHHRRGLRDHYIRELEGHLSHVPAQGLASNVLPIIAAIYGSVIADWLAVLDWADILISQTEDIDPGLLELRDRIAAVRAFGAPFALGADEQLDSPWDDCLTSKPWDELGETISRLVGQGIASPFECVSMAATTRLLEARLAEGWCIILPTFANEPVALWVFQGGRYTRRGLPGLSMSAWKVVRRHFTVGTATKQRFAEELNRYSEHVRAVFKADFDALPSTCPGILSLQDYGNALPITVATLRHDGLRARMAAGAFDVRIVPTLYPGRPQSPFAHPKVVALIDSGDNLALARVEAGVAARVLEADPFVAVEVSDEHGLVGQMADAEILIVSTHGASIAGFSDPILGSLGGARPHAITVKTLQRDFGILPYRLAMLNACYAGATSADSEHTRRTHDPASYPALLLLNRCSVVSAASWRIGDMISFLYLMLTAQGLKDGLPASRALCRATARLHELSTLDARSLLSTAPVSEGRDRALALLERAPATGAFADLYKVGGIDAYTLF